MRKCRVADSRRVLGARPSRGYGTGTTEPILPCINRWSLTDVCATQGLGYSEQRIV